MDAFVGNPFVDAGEVVVASDPKATRNVALLRRNAPGNIELLSRRDGPSGSLFTIREIRSEDGFWRYLCEGEDIHQLEENYGKFESQFSETIDGSIADVVVKHAISKMLEIETRASK